MTVVVANGFVPLPMVNPAVKSGRLPVVSVSAPSPRWMINCAVGFRNVVWAKVARGTFALRS